MHSDIHGLTITSKKLKPESQLAPAPSFRAVRESNRRMLLRRLLLSGYACFLAAFILCCAGRDGAGYFLATGVVLLLPGACNVGLNVQPKYSATDIPKALRRWWSG